MRSSSDPTHRLRQGTLRVVPVALLLLVALSGCESDEEKVAALLEASRALQSEEKHAEAAIELRNLLQVEPNHAEGHFLLARSYLHLGKGREALWEFAEAVRLDESNVDARMHLGSLALLGSDFEEVDAQAKAILEIEPDNANAHTLLGQALEGLGQADEAEPHYLRAVEIEPEKGPYLHVLASYYVRRGDRASAEPAFVRNTELDPSFQAYTALARFLAEDPSRDANAVTAFEKAVEVAEGEDTVSAYQSLARLHFSRDRFEDAVKVLETGIAKLADSPSHKLELMYLLARLHGEKGNDAAAAAILEEAVAVDPESVQPYLTLADSRNERGDSAGALEAIEKALAVDPKHTNALLEKAALLARDGRSKDDPARIEEGAKLAEQVLAAEPTNPSALLVKAKIAIATEDTEAATQAARAAVEAQPNWGQAHYILGTALAKSGNHSAARAEVARAVELEPGNRDARRLLAHLHSALGEHEYAVEQGRVYLQANPTDVETRILVAQSLASIGRTDEAIAEIATVGEDRLDAKVLFAKGRLLQAQGKPEEAREVLLEADALNPHHPEILRLLLGIEAASGRLDEAGARIERALAAKPDDAQLVRLSATYALRKGDVAAAEKKLERALELDPGNLPAYQQLATIYQNSGRLDETMKTYERALEKHPDAAQIHHFLAVLYEMDGDTDRAIAGYEKAIALDENMGLSKNNLAYLLAESGKDLDRALSLAQEAKAMMPESPNAADTLGWVLYRRGIPSAAVGYLREAISGLEEGSPEIGMVRHHLALAYEANDQKQMAIDALELSLAQLEERQGKARAAGGKPEEPDWSGPAREMLARLKSAG
jgi:tetratricopeptide (TPR) repeat protein